MNAAAHHLLATIGVALVIGVAVVIAGFGVVAYAMWKSVSRGRSW